LERMEHRRTPERLSRKGTAKSRRGTRPPVPMVRKVPCRVKVEPGIPPCTIAPFSVIVSSGKRSYDPRRNIPLVMQPVAVVARAGAADRRAWRGRQNGVLETDRSV
jgi:hypothetical protein